MEKLSRAIARSRVPIFIASLLLLIPAILGYIGTRVNYDILTYLPEEIETMRGQELLEEEFGTGAFAMYIVEGMPYKDVAKLKAEIEDIEHVKSVIWYDTVMDISVPVEMLPDRLKNTFVNGDTTMMFVIFDETTSSDGTMEAVENIRKAGDRRCFLSGMSAIVLDTKNMAEAETPVYVGIAVILAVIVLSLTMDSWIIPFFFLLSIGIAIIYNLGSNIIFGEISFVTQALAAVLQLGVTLDYSIFLWHSYEEETEKDGGDADHCEAMARAIASTIQSVVGSSITTVAGFIALCFMSFTLGLDIGLVMAKGVVFGVVGCVTILPSMILVFDRALERTKHRPLLPEFNRIPRLIAKHYWLFGLVFLAILPVALYGYSHTSVYYNLSDTLPDSLESVQAMALQEERFETNTTYMILVDSDMDATEKNRMTEELEAVDGVESVLGIASVTGPALPESILPDRLLGELKSESYEMIMVNSAYKVASDEVNEQIELVNDIVKGHDEGAMVVGEAPCTKDLIIITDHDFAVVSWVSIIFVFVIILFVMRSLSLPVILVSVIEFAIFINMGLPYYTGTVIPFISSVVIGTIQLGATVDYAILMTTRYCRERGAGHDKMESTIITLQTCMKSVIVSALSFFSATFGVGLISSIDMIGSLCMLMARGALISMAVVLLVLPSMYMLFDGVIIRSTMGVNVKDKESGKKRGFRSADAA